MRLGITGLPELYKKGCVLIQIVVYLSLFMCRPLDGFAKPALNQDKGKIILPKNIVNGINTLTQEMFKDANAVYVIKHKYTIKDKIVIPENCVLEFKGGCLNSGIITPNKTVVVSKRKQRIFNDVSFNTSLEHNFENSSLFATNFGFKSDMYSKKESYIFEGRTYTARVRKGSSNNNIIKELAAFCSYSNGVPIFFNGKFLGDANCTIKNASNLEIYGGTVQSGLLLTDCKYCIIHDMNIVGYHEIHEFPSFVLSDNTWMKFGLVPQYGIMCKTSKHTDEDDKSECHHIKISNCHIEMRMAGIHFGDIDKKNGYVFRPRDCQAFNCCGDHLIWQISGMHAIDCTADNISSNYAFLAFDISTGSIRCTIKNSESSNVYVGGKMQGEENYVSYGNCLIGIKELVNDIFPCRYEGGTYGAFINHCENCTIEDYDITIDNAHKYTPVYINNVSVANVKNIKVRTKNGGHVTTVVNYYMPSGDIHIKNIDAECLLNGNNIVNIGKPSNNAFMFIYDSRFDVRRVDGKSNNYFSIPAQLVENSQINTNDAYLHTVNNIKDSRINTRFIKTYRSLDNSEVMENNR